MTLSARLRRFAASGGTPRQLIGTALAGLILGVGAVVISASLARATERNGLLGFLDDLFRPAAPAPVAVPPRPRRYAALPEPRALPERRLVQAPRHRLTDLRGTSPERRASIRRDRAAAQAPAGTRTVCVRACDGYLFPLGNLASRRDLPVHESACAAACPSAATSLYTLAPGETDLDRAVSLKGQPYLGAAFANVYRRRRVADCSCQPAGGAAPFPIAQDGTLRRGDVVALRSTVGVVSQARSGSLELVDFRHARNLSAARTRTIEDRVGVLRREAEARAFRRAMRAADRAGIVRVAAAGGGFAPVLPAETARGGFGPVRVVVPAPYGH
ncbi:DUF2865 domain-containing protein [Methylobacterium oxalidis]|uniref:DUF2865 domain-containing protein n=1 Tax=Methylobacterium oxalidis TaxID=944322 RepID=A0A512J7I0_9HYPH|nr:DUF2865 domain-containing protein [Methylobacterium oxalidis]GEP05893.1 hypothetical protein MOX02_39310 [Methylobacterium oxalidis]GJE32502.1 hypothetical protein LDDCCGHA_2688 [Methylobacterium oxalidis]GLS61660.1 hypothetical protein GCM10007888_00410 [Methylobacterium oxalidis]